MKNIIAFAFIALLFAVGCESSTSGTDTRPAPMTTSSGVYTAVVQPGSGYQLIGDSIVVPPSNGTFVPISFNIYLDGALHSPQVVDVSIWSYDLLTEEYIVVANGSGTGKYKQKMTTAGLVSGQAYRFVVSIGTSQNDLTQILTEPIVFQ